MSEELIREYEERDEEDSADSESEDENSTSNKDRLVELSDTEETKKGNDDKKDKDKDKPLKERRRSLKPRVTLNDRILKHPKKGISKIETYFENFNFLGKGHEKEDLDRVMKKLEHWSHRLFPMYDFDDFLEKTEQIGLKRLMSAYVEKYRTDMLEEDLVLDEEDEPSMAVVADDPFDDLLTEHAPIRRQMSEAPKVPLSDEAKERIERNRLLALEKKKAREAERQKQAEEARMQSLELGRPEIVTETQDSVPVQHSEEKEVEMSLEERIEMKRQMALAKKLARQKEIEQRKAAESRIQDKVDERLTVVEKDSQLDNQISEDVVDNNLDQDSKDPEEEERKEKEKVESMEVTEEVEGSSEKMDV